jgi:hypothetical protein
VTFINDFIIQALKFEAKLGYGLGIFKRFGGIINSPHLLLSKINNCQPGVIEHTILAYMCLPKIIMK